MLLIIFEQSHTLKHTWHHTWAVKQTKSCVASGWLLERFHTMDKLKRCLVTLIQPGYQDDMARPHYGFCITISASHTLAVPFVELSLVIVGSKPGEWNAGFFRAEGHGPAHNDTWCLYHWWSLSPKFREELWVSQEFISPDGFQSIHVWYPSIGLYPWTYGYLSCTMIFSGFSEVLLAMNPIGCFPTRIIFSYTYQFWILGDDIWLYPSSKATTNG